MNLLIYQEQCFRRFWIIRCVLIPLSSYQWAGESDTQDQLLNDDLSLSRSLARLREHAQRPRFSAFPCCSVCQQIEVDHRGW